MRPTFSAVPLCATSLGVNEEVRLALITPIGAGWQPSPEVVSGRLGRQLFRRPRRRRGSDDHDQRPRRKRQVSVKMRPAVSAGFTAAATCMFGNAMAGFDGGADSGRYPREWSSAGRARDPLQGLFRRRPSRARAGYAFGHASRPTSPRASPGTTASRRTRRMAISATRFPTSRASSAWASSYMASDRINDQSRVRP